MVNQDAKDVNGNDLVDVLFGQNSDYSTETELEQKAMQLIQNTQYYIENRYTQTPPNIRAEAISLVNNMKLFLSKYPLKLDEFDSIKKKLITNSYSIVIVQKQINAAALEFANLAGKRLKFRARVNQVPESEYHFLYRGFKSPSAPETGKGLQK